MNKINPIYHQQPLPVTKPKEKVDPPTKDSFKSVLQQVTNDNVKVSKHAIKRMEERNIEISEDQWSKIEDKMVEAKQKGITDSAVILPDAVLVASTKNQTIITAMSGEEASDQLLTNINGTIILRD
ncbi:TIGR02530 family flagellar biosynthesis protein [Alkalibacillus silvisoli]|uniref:Flagellar protein n=1 Tax=Alkalibacillus silvisoli TaxID=392823 RepID=A0ABN0ZWF7_9BACI